MRILLVEDELDAARLTASLIAQAGFDVDQARCLSAAREAVARSNYDLLLLDRRLPDGDGLSLMPLARELRPGIRVMMLTAVDDTGEKVSSFDLGADDYVTKPFQGEELVARIRACIRRPGSGAPKPITVGALSFDLATRDVRISGCTVALHRRELALLESLMRRVNRVVSREMLLDEVFSPCDDVQDNTLDMAVSRLRRRLIALDARVAIHTVRGVGYMATELFD
ncbi:MAG: response regulator transcription factor [Methylocystis sp.]